MMIGGQQDGIIELLSKYYPEWNDAGKNFADELKKGFVNQADEFENSVKDTMKSFKKDMSSEEMSASINTDNKSSLDIKSDGLFDGITSVLAGVSASVKEVERLNLNIQAQVPNITINNYNTFQNNNDIQKFMNEMERGIKRIAGGRGYLVWLKCLITLI
ncbi:hypothetical protein FACS1894188_10240 [Clostridia bacterium]|nr:hypothetical protein FACS1894188_10240 [Clostridia bacterium]